MDVSNNSDGSSAQQCAHEPNSISPRETRVYTCQYTYVRIRSNAKTYMTLCEVQVQAEGEYFHLIRNK